MGLDICAYSNVRPAAVETGDEWEQQTISSAVLEWQEKHFPGRADGLRSGTYESGDEYRFRAGSYTGYGEFRRQLATLAGFGSIEDVWGPELHTGTMVELLNFADNEGYIGPETSAKLAGDFEELQAHAHERWHEGHWCRRVYDNFLDAFRLAADGGYIEFR